MTNPLQTRDDCADGADALAKRDRAIAWRREQFQRRPPEPSPPARRPVAVPRARPVAVAPAPPPEKEVAPARRPRLTDIAAAVAEYFHLQPMDIISQRRQYPLSFARQIVAFLACELTPLSLTQIGRSLERDHTTILHSQRRIEEMLALDHPVAIAAVSAIRTFLTTGERNFPPLLVPTKGYWTGKEVRQLRRMYAEGAEPIEIGAVLGRSSDAVQMKLQKLKKLEKRAGI